MHSQLFWYMFFTGPSALTVNIMKNIENSSVVVQWDAVDDFLTTTYVTTWAWYYEGEYKFLSAAVIEQTSYTIYRLTLDTVYTIYVTAANRCGSGPEFATSILLSANTTSTTSSISPTVITSTNPMTIMSTASSVTITTSTSIVTTTTAMIYPSATANKLITTTVSRNITTTTTNTFNITSLDGTVTTTTLMESSTTTAVTNIICT